MKILIELDDDDGDLLDKLAEEQDRSRSAQARRMLTKAIWEATNKPLPLTHESDN
jgi:predicted transcriptional regulator